MAQRGYDSRPYRTYDADYDMRLMDHRCPSDSDPSEAPSEDSDNSSAAPPRRYRASQKNHRSRNNKVRTLNRWTTDEHDKLAYLVDKWGSEKNWAKVAEEMPGRTGKQCRERWLNHMKPGIIKGNWSPEEEYLLAQCHALVGSHWSKMTKRLPGRTENSIKNFWNATLRSKAPNKKRGMLWTYMQLHDAKSDDNTIALTTAVSRLHETRELPPHMLAQLDAQMLDSRTWKSIHKAEKEFLENIGGELHYMALPHPTSGGMAAATSSQQQGYAGLAGAGSLPAGGSPSASPVASSSQIQDYSSMGHQHMGSLIAGGSGSQAVYLQHQQPNRSIDVKQELPDACYTMSSMANSHQHHQHHQHHQLEGCMGGLMGAGAGAVPGGAAGGYGMTNLLTAQDPLLSCVPDNIDHAELLKMFETSSHQHHVGASLGSCPTMQVNNGSMFSSAGRVGSAGGAGEGCGDAAAGAMDVVPPPKELAPIVTAVPKQEPYASMEAAGSYQSQQLGSLPGSKASTMTTEAGLQLGAAAECHDGAAAPDPPASASYGQHSRSSHLLHHLSPVPSCEPGTGTPMNGSPLLNAIGMHDQQVAGVPGMSGPAGGAAGAGAGASGAFCSASAAAVAEINRRQASSPAAYNDTRSDISYGGAAAGSGRVAGRAAGGHGPHCSCGPCSNSRKLHGLHSPGARRNARSSSTNNGGQRFRSMASLTQANDVGGPAYQPSSKLQRQAKSYAAQAEPAAVPGSYMDAGSYYVSQQQQQQMYGSCSQAALAGSALGDYSAVQAAAFQSFSNSFCAATAPAAAGPAAAAGVPGSLQQRAKQEPRCESPFAQQAAAGWDAAPAAVAEVSVPAVMRPDMQPAAQHAAAAAPALDPVSEALASMPWLSSHDRQQQQAGSSATGQQQTVGGQRGPGVKLDLSHLTVPGLGADALTGFLLSPLGLGLLSPLGGLMMPPPSTRSVRLPSFGQITMQRASINGAEWDWDSLLAADIAHNNAARSARPSENGESIAALAASSGQASASRAGTKRARCSLTSVEDDAALLIDMQPAKVARGGETSASGTIYGCGNGWSTRDFLDRF